MTEFLIGTLKVAAIIAAVCMIPTVLRFIHFIIKRITLYVKLKIRCRKNGCSLIPAHFMWPFGTKRGRRYDFYIEFPDAVYAVKLWNTRGVTEELTFTDDGYAHSRVYTRIPVFRMIFFWYPHDTKKYRLPQYELTRQATPVLLINPVPFEVYCPDDPSLHLPGSAGQVNGMHIFSLGTILNSREEEMANL